jgi:hypothetical protein
MSAQVPHRAAASPDSHLPASRIGFTVGTGLRIAFESETQASGYSVCLSFAQNGMPLLPAEPFMVADFEDVYVKASDGGWRIKERRIKPVFRREGFS